MQIPREVLAATRNRMQFDPSALRKFLRDKRPVDVNSPERVHNWLSSAPVLRAATEGMALERIIGTNDLLPINYLMRGRNAANAVGRISINDPATGQLVGFGTGFLISPNLLITNHHVLGDAATAGASSVEFRYEIDADGKKMASEVFSLDATTFVTSEALDYSVVAVSPKSERNVPLLDFGFLKLDPTPGKTLDGQFLTIIQHPSGERKQIAIRENQLIKTVDNFLWYATDTAPGSSGSVVANDAWQAVALHHSGVPATNAQGQTLTVDGGVATAETPDSQIKWIANEGVRISSIVADLRKFTAQPLIATLIKLVDGGTSPAKQPEIAPQPLNIVYASPDAPAAKIAVIGAEKISIDPNYDNREGYNPSFLGGGDKRVPLPLLTVDQMKLVPQKNEEDNHPAHVLAYHHYSVVFNAKRHLAFYTAVNIDGSLTLRLKREPDSWKKDPRISLDVQAGEELYKDNDFDRGHLVRRLDPAWGENKNIAKVANDDTFHFTNCSPQHKDFNQGQQLWAGLEDYILNNADNDDLKVTVFNGPVFRDDDQSYRGVLIPQEYWKVVTMVKSSGSVSATAYIVSQKDLIGSMTDEDFVFGKYRTFQVPISRLEELTKLNFGKLRGFDPLASGGSHEAAVAGRLITSPHQLVL